MPQPSAPAAIQTLPKDWTKEDLEQIREDLEQGIRRRKEEQEDLGEDPGHRNRIREEERLKKQIEKKLGLAGAESTCSKSLACPQSRQR